ncbi:MAG TPA: response regulator [Verrucomicrobiae bacterium]|nr:response regulator [Verrucomicrobiae bacterium]
MSAKTVLVVDDSGFARRMLRRMLEEGGFRVEEANGGNEAMEKYQITKPDVVLLDIVMGEMGGFEVLQKLRQMDPEAAVVMATADIQKITRDEALGAGAAGFVNKPFDAEEVLGEVRRVTNGRG